MEGLRRALLRLARALSRLYKVQALSSLRQGDGGAALEQLEDSVQYAAKLCAGARRRMGLPEAPSDPAVGRAVRALGMAVERSARELEDDLRQAVRDAIDAAREDLPGGMAEVVAKVLARLGALPQEVSMEINIEFTTPGQSERLQLPPWLPPSRIVGGFYILRPIGTGGGGSVFVARRAEERHDEEAETFALKLPSFDGQNAHTLTEEEFLRLFREEAGALLTLPQHPNLAGFVTFDARARPKPILVMELVRGSTLERVIDKRELSVPFAFAILDGVAAGLEAMHADGLGHLDVKPGNIILRETQPLTGSRLVPADQVTPTPVLVDFGLAGRKVRPGCASPYYGAPELWDAVVFQASTGPSRGGRLRLLLPGLRAADQPHAVRGRHAAVADLRPPGPQRQPARPRTPARRPPPGPVRPDHRRRPDPRPAPPRHHLPGPPGPAQPRPPDVRRPLARGRLTPDRLSRMARPAAVASPDCALRQRSPSCNPAAGGFRSGAVRW